MPNYYGNKGIPLYFLGDYAASTEAYQKAIEYALEVGDSIYMGKTYLNISFNYHALEDYEKARIQ